MSICNISGDFYYIGGDSATRRDLDPVPLTHEIINICDPRFLRIDGNIISFISNTFNIEVDVYTGVCCVSNNETPQEIPPYTGISNVKKISSIS